MWYLYWLRSVRIESQSMDKMFVFPEIAAAFLGKHFLIID